MRPLIPRVRVGDILKGTRNLRCYLQTAMTLNYVQSVAEGVPPDRARISNNPYTPSKTDEFLVTVNAWDSFAVCDVNNHVVLVFLNPGTGHSRIRSTKIRMDPTVFSKWFIRTEQKKVDITTWPKYALLLRGALHFSLNSVPDGINFPLHGSNMGVFTMHNIGDKWEGDPLLLAQTLKKWTVRGITRPSIRAVYSGRASNGSGFGPHLDDIVSMKEYIREMCTDHRVAQRIRADKSTPLQSYL